MHNPPRVDVSLSAVLDTVLDGIIVIDGTGRIHTFSKAASAIFGYVSEEVLGRNVSMLMPEPYHSAHDGYLHHYLKTGERKIIGIGREVVGRRKDGSTFPMELGINETTVDGHPMFVGIVRDITARKHAEELLRNETVRLTAVMNTVLDGLITINSKCIIQSFNPSAVRIFGYEPSEVLGKNISMLMPEPYRSEHDRYVQSYLETNTRKVIGIGREVVGQRKDGSTFPMELGINEMKLDSERMFVGTVRDITYRKQSEQYNNALISRLCDSNAELERFAYVASHDLQEPIRMVNNFSRILLSDYQHLLDETGQQYLSMVIDSGERMRDMINDLLEYSRMNNETMRFHVFDANQVLQSALENIQALIEEQHATITFDKLPNLYGSPVQIMRLLQNLIINAIKYQRKNTPPNVHIWAEASDDKWLIHVKDNGVGIDPKFYAQIFEPFRRLHTWDAVKGSGLGLSICKKIAETNNGTLSVVSVPGEGSTFTIALPRT